MRIRDKTICLVCSFLISFAITTKVMASVKGKVGNVYKGYATWYNEPLRKIPMASGLMFDNRRMEAAHRNLRFGTVVKVTSNKTKLSVVVVIADRGPCSHVNTTAPLSHTGCPKPPEGKAINKSRIIDLTPVAAAEIGMLELRPGKRPKEISGVSKVTVEILQTGTCWSWGSCKKRPFKRGKMYHEIRDDGRN